MRVRTRTLIVVLVAAALAAAVKVGVDLRAALGQVDALVGVVAVDASRAVEPVVTPAPPRRVAPPSPAAVLDDAPAGEPAPRFDVEEAVRAAGDRDQNVAELLNDPDPAIGAAIRDLITQLEAPGGR